MKQYEYNTVIVGELEHLGGMQRIPCSIWDRVIFVL